MTTVNMDHLHTPEAREARKNAEPFDPIAKSKRQPKSLRMAINAKCWDCVGAGVDPNPRQAIRECGGTRCPLYFSRPYQLEKVEARK